MNWSDVSMFEAIRFATGKKVDPDARRPKGSFFDSGCVVFTDGTAIEVFTDGTAIECTSEISGPYSDVTPDVDNHEPSWRIFGTVEQEQLEPYFSCELCGAQGLRKSDGTIIDGKCLGCFKRLETQKPGV